MTGFDKAKEIADKLRNEVKTDTTVKAVRAEEISNAISAIQGNSDLLRMYNESASLGSENLGGESLPLLKIHSAGRSLNDELANGEEPQNGYFFYKKTKEQFKTVTAHILTISEGFRADGIEGKTNVFNQIMAGVIVNDGVFKPFLMYFTGTKLNALWEFGKKAAEWTKAKPLSIPLFCLTVEIKSKKVVDGTKSWWIAEFEILKNEDGGPIVVTDIQKFEMLRDNIDTMKSVINKLIQSKSTEDTAQVINSDTATNGLPDIDFSSGEPEKVTEEMPF